MKLFMNIDHLTDKIQNAAEILIMELHYVLTYISIHQEAYVGIKKMARAARIWTAVR